MWLVAIGISTPALIVGHIKTARMLDGFKSYCSGPLASWCWATVQGTKKPLQMLWRMELLSVVLLPLFCLVAISPVCGQNSLSEADQQEILEAHNRFRSMVDPPASNMRRMVSIKMAWLVVSITIQLGVLHWHVAGAAGQLRLVYATVVGKRICDSATIHHE